MTIINIDGDILSIVTKPKIGFQTYVDVIKFVNNSAPSGLNPKTIIEPTGAEVSRIKLSHDPSAIAFYVTSPSTFTGFSGFILSDDFEIEDTVEFYCGHTDPEGLEGSLVSDNSGHDIIFTADTQKLIVVKKIFSGTGNDWFTYRI